MVMIMLLYFHHHHHPHTSHYLTVVQVFPPVDIYKCKETTEYYGGSYLSEQSLPTSMSLFAGIKATICLKPLEVDEWISRGLEYYGWWEGASVSTILKAMSVYPSAVFLDIGCNIGTFTLLVAAGGYQVVGVVICQNSPYLLFVTRWWGWMHCLQTLHTFIIVFRSGEASIKT